MTRTEKIVVIVEIDVRETAHMDAETAIKHIINTVRHKADEEAAQRRGAKVLTERLPALDIKRGEHKLLGLSFWLVWSEWDVEVPA